MSAATADIAVFSKDRRPVLVVEVKDSDRYSTVDDAAALRRSLLAHKLLPAAPFFMLATPAQIYLWPSEAAAAEPPQYSASAKAIVDSYGPPRGDRARSTFGGALEVAFFSWISDLANGIRKPSADLEPEKLLLDSGLYEQLRDGTAKYDVYL